MKAITLGSTGITAIQNGFGCLPVQRVSVDEGVEILKKAYEGGMRFFDTARAYTDSELKLGLALHEFERSSYYVATKSISRDLEGLKKDFETSLKTLNMPYIDIYQFHQSDVCYKPGDGSGMYEYMLELKEKGLIKHIGITTHKLMVAREAIESGLYETLQYPFSYLAIDKEIELVKMCKEHNMGFIAMKGLAGGLLNNTKVCMAFMSQFDNVMPIWGIQRLSELEQWLSYNDKDVELTEEDREFIRKEKEELGGDFCRGCGYCMPCPVGIKINTLARMSLMLRRAPTERRLSEQWQAEMRKVEECLHCYQCASKCPYELDTPALLQKNYDDYMAVLRGDVKI